MRPRKRTSKASRFAGLAAITFATCFAGNQLHGQGATSYAFTSLAGQPAVLDHLDGTGTNARFLNPAAVTVDTAGNTYVADSGDHTIRIISSGGVVSTLAGSSGRAGTSDGSGTGALFIYPSALAVDSAGNVYVADAGANTIRRVTAAGVVTTIAGAAGVAGSVDGIGTAAQFNAPQGIAVDSAGDIYVADTNNSTIRKIAASNHQVSTFAGNAGAAGSGNGTGSGAHFNYPVGLAIDTAGNIYVADFDNSTIREITPAGSVTTIAGTATQTGTTDGTAALFNHPEGLWVDAGGNVYVADTSNQTIRKIAVTSLIVSTVAGTAGITGHADGLGASATFAYPGGVTVNPSGTIIVADTGNHSIRTINPGVGSSVTTWAGAAGTMGSANGTGTGAAFAYPDGVALDAAGNVYVADRNNDTIREISPSGAVITLAGAAGVAGSADGAGTVARFNTPTGVAVDGAGNVYVADSGNSTIRKISGGAVSTYAGYPGTVGGADATGNSASFNHAQGVAVDAAGNVWVADTNNCTIRIITPAGAFGAVRTVAVSVGQVGTTDGSGTGARFNAPNALTVASSGTVYVSDLGNYTIRAVTAAGAVTTLAGGAGQAGDADGSGTAARFNQTYGIAVDSGQNLYVSDALNRVVREITPAGAVTTITGSQTLFLYPEGVAVNGSDTLFVADGDNQTVLVGLALSPPPTSSSPGNHTVAVGGSASFTVTSNVSASYQWQLSTNGGASWSNVSNGSTYGGATTATLTVSNATAAMNNNQYRAVLAATAGGATSDSAAGILYVGTSRLSNLSSRAFVGTGANALFAGFVIQGTGAKEILLRGIGPTLGTFGIGGPLATPQLTLDGAGSVTLGANTVWGGSTALANVMSAVGAFTLPATSADSALYQSLPVGAYSSEVSGVGGSTGVALDEIYDADTGTTTPAAQLANISSRASVGTGSNVLEAGFVIVGNTSMTVLVRGIGPGLAAYGLSGLLATPQLTLFDSSNNPVATNTGWGNASVTGSSTVGATVTGATASIFTSVGAFALTSGSTDCAMVVTLPPGIYTAELSGVNSTSGVGMVEIYQVP